MERSLLSAAFFVRLRLVFNHSTYFNGTRLIIPTSPIFAKLKNSNGHIADNQGISRKKFGRFI